MQSSGMPIAIAILTFWQRLEIQLIVITNIRSVLTELFSSDSLHFTFFDAIQNKVLIYSM